MIGQKVQSEISPERFVINVIQRNVEEGSRKRKEEYSTAVRLRKILISLVNIYLHIKKKGFGKTSPYFINSIRKATEFLKSYLDDVAGIISRIEETKKESQIEQLKIIQKVDRIMALVDNAITKIGQLRDYPSNVKSQTDFDRVKDIFKELKDLPDEIEDALKLKHGETRRIQRSERSLAWGKMPIRPMRLYLIPKIKDEERKAVEQRIYFTDEKGLEDHLGLLLQQFKSEADNVIARINQFYGMKNQENVPIQQMEYTTAILKKQIINEFGNLSRIAYAFVHETKNLLDFYRRHFHSTINLDIDLDLEEAEKLREMEAITGLLEKLPDDDDDDEALRQLKDMVKFLSGLRQKILIYARYDFLREEYIDRTAVAEFIKSRRIKEHKDVEYKTGYKSTVYSFKFTIKGSRGWIRGEIFLKDPKKVPEKAVIMVPGFSTYRELHYNINSFFAEDNYLALIIDIASQGESRGKYGYAEGSENVMILAKYLKETYKVSKIAVMGHSVGGTVTLFTLLHYDTIVDSVVREHREKCAEFWKSVIKDKGKILKSGKDVFKSWIKIWKGEAEKEIKNAIISSYSRWNNYIDVVGMLNPNFEEIPSQLKVPGSSLHLPKFMLYLFLTSKLGDSIFRADVSKVATFGNIETQRHKAFKRLVRIKKESDQKRYQELKDLDPIFVKGLSIFDKDQFYREIAYDIVPLTYLSLIEQFYPEVLGDIHRVPKLFFFAEEDPLFKFEKSKKFYEICSRQFKNCQSINMSGVGHGVTYPGELLYHFVPFNATFLNYLHDYLKYNL